MTREEFCAVLKDELAEKTDITPETNFKNLDSYGSLSSVLVLQLIEDRLGVQLNPRNFRKIQTVNDIFDEAAQAI
ncbi:phosphopantetheine-binding protein [Chryseobacterium taklimakanense]|uniref:acyl carrier protein n=1 Tax=Chryseobacterium taklimakanense TaxID=536441 RepID=UPI001EF5C502|nr:phosphopantetheine-binding protein [Chryseobacterium taklimakanense]MCG7281461.1 phosphopantetheine-binding protein [Chryseobacterium taklimakanense]